MKARATLPCFSLFLCSVVCVMLKSIPCHNPECRVREKAVSPEEVKPDVVGTETTETVDLTTLELEPVGAETVKDPTDGSFETAKLVRESCLNVSFFLLGLLFGRSNSLDWKILRDGDISLISECYSRCGS